MDVSPDLLLRLACPAGATITSHPSSKRIGTAYGNWLGRMYVEELRERDELKTYAVVDFLVYTASMEWGVGNVWSLRYFDPLVYGALTTSEWWNGWRERPDILNADTDEVYEIKPLRKRDDGPEQLQGYIDTLNAMAPHTPAGVLIPRARNWRPGGWDPSRYPLIIGGFGGGGGICVLHAWQDEDCPGLIVYDIKCCRTPDKGEHKELRATQVRWVVPEVEEQFRPVFEEWRAAELPLGASGARYAVLTSELFFEVFVKGSSERNLDRDIWDRYSRAHDVQRKGTLQVTAFEHALRSGGGSVALAFGGLFSPETRQYLETLGASMGYIAIGLAAAGVFVIGVYAVGTVALAALAKAGVAATAGTGVTATTATTLATGTRVAAHLAPRVLSQTPRAASRLLNGSSRLYSLLPSASRAVGVGRGAASTIASAADKVGIGVAGALFYVVAPADALAQEGTVQPDLGEIVVAELPLLVPVELLDPVGSSTVGAGSFVKMGGEKFFVPAIVTADAD